MSNEKRNCGGCKRTAKDVVYFIRVSYRRDKYWNNAHALKRLQSLAAASPVRLALLITTPGTFRLKQRLHRKFEHLRSTGEWFRDDVELHEFIEQMRANPLQAPLAPDKRGPKPRPNTTVKPRKLSDRIVMMMRASDRVSWSAAEMANAIGESRSRDIGRLMSASNRIQRLAIGRYQLVDTMKEKDRASP